MPFKIQDTQLVSAGFYLLNSGYVASYLLDAGDSLVAFDTGMSRKMLLAQMDILNLDAAKVLDVFLTHSDPDHTGGIKAFPKATAHISSAEVAMLDGTTPRFFGRVHSKPLPFAYETLDDGQEIRIGSAKITCMATPGHTSGSMSYLINDSILVVGDEMNLKQGRAVLDMKFISIDNTKRKESLIRLAQMKGVTLLCTAHSGYTDDFDAAMEGWV